MGYYVEHHNDELIIILIVKLPKSLWEKGEVKKSTCEQFFSLK